MAAVEHPYEDLSGGRWRAGDLHPHTTCSDGHRAQGYVALGWNVAYGKGSMRRRKTRAARSGKQR